LESIEHGYQCLRKLEVRARERLVFDYLEAILLCEAAEDLIILRCPYSKSVIKPMEP
jgi:hypothetical protein